MIDRKSLLSDLRREARRLESDLAERAGSDPEMTLALEAEYRAAGEAGRTSDTFLTWRCGALTQAAVAWLLGCVFVRFAEDNDLVEEALIAGPGERNMRAADRQTLYFRTRPTDSDRDYLLDVFAAAERLPGMTRLYDHEHNPVWRYGISGDAARDLLAFWRSVDPDTGALRHDFTDPDWDTRFLGDLYQDLSDDAKKRFALLQTPEFVEEFILNRTLTPALDEFGLPGIRLIDPACGSGHFLLGAFARLVREWFGREPVTPERVLVQRALDGVHGVDINPFAAAIARFRLLVAALNASDIKRLDDAPNFRIHVTAGDSLLHGRRFDQFDIGSGADQLASRTEFGHAFATEDLDELNRILAQQYHVVVGNPPYVTVKDAAVNRLYRMRYTTCHRQYSLAVPFTERFFDLALPEDGSQRAGYVGMITANSFMKREFGKKLIESFLPRVDLTHVVDTSGAYIPGHGTPTVILLARTRAPTGGGVRTVMGIRGEPETPAEPARGLVWQAITSQIDHAGSESNWIGVADVRRSVFSGHPWSVSGGAAASLKELLDQHSIRLGDLVESVGFASFTGTDDAFVAPRDYFRRLGISPEIVRRFVFGETLRDWSYEESTAALVPYDTAQAPLEYVPESPWGRHLWPFRATIGGVKSFGGKTRAECGDRWWTWYRWVSRKYATPLSITFAFVATHNHFVLDRGGKVFSRTAQVIKLPPNDTEAIHLGLIGLLNSSVACFWMKNTFHDKGGAGAWERRFEHAGTALKQFPLPNSQPVEIATMLDRLAIGRQPHLPPKLIDCFPMPPAKLNGHRDTAAKLLERMIALQEELDWGCYRLYGVTEVDCRYTGKATSSSERSLGSGQVADELIPHGDNPTFHSKQAQRARIDHRLNPSLHRTDNSPPEAIASTSAATGRGGHEKDWMGQESPPLALGERAFEIVMARRMATGELETTWFARHGSTPITDLPGHWPDDYRALVERRIELIETDRFIGLLERPEYKRRWNVEPWHDQERRALRSWLLDRLESPAYWPEKCLATVRTLSERAATDADFQQVASHYAGNAGIDIGALVAELVESESVPALRVQRHKPSGLTKRADWERTWALQRREDEIDAEVAASTPRCEDETEEDHAARLQAEQRRRKQEEVGNLTPPPKYRATDFLKPTYWRLRGALDVPKERFVSLPDMSRDNDPTLLVGWAGWNALELCQAVATYYAEVVEQDGWTTERLTPLLAVLQENLPWLKQWHNDLDPEYNQRLGDFFETFLHSQLSTHTLTAEDLRNWTPPRPQLTQRSK